MADELADVDRKATNATGKGLDNNRLWKVAHNYPVEYMYYRNPGQLKKRLKLLFAERSAELIFC